jgi:hypothetical protein
MEWLWVRTCLERVHASLRDAKVPGDPGRGEKVGKRERVKGSRCESEKAGKCESELVNANTGERASVFP